MVPGDSDAKRVVNLLCHGDLDSEEGGSDTEEGPSSARADAGSNTLVWNDLSRRDRTWPPYSVANAASNKTTTYRQKPHPLIRSVLFSHQRTLPTFRWTGYGGRGATYQACQCAGKAGRGEGLGSSMPNGHFTTNGTSNRSTKFPEPFKEVHSDGDGPKTERDVAKERGKTRRERGSGRVKDGDPGCNVLAFYEFDPLEENDLP